MQPLNYQPNTAGNFNALRLGAAMILQNSVADNCNLTACVMYWRNEYSFPSWFVTCIRRITIGENLFSAKLHTGKILILNFLLHANVSSVKAVKQFIHSQNVCIMSNTINR